MSPHRSGFVITIDTTAAKDPRKRVDEILIGVRRDLAAGHTQGAVMLEGRRVGAWKFTR